MTIIPEIGSWVAYSEVVLPVLVVDTNIGRSCFTGIVYDARNAEVREDLLFSKITDLVPEAEARKLVVRRNHKRMPFGVNLFALRASVRQYLKQRPGCW